MAVAELKLFADSLCSDITEADPFINRGHGMAALTLFEAGSSSFEKKYVQAANDHLDRSINLLDQLPLSNSLYRGVTGLGWIVRKYYNEVDRDWKTEFLADLDSHLTEGVLESGNLNIDVVDGLAGIMIYANTSGGAPYTKEHRLLRDAIRDVIPKYLGRFTDSADNKPKAYANLGMAHGIPGLLTQCARFIESDDSSDHLINPLRQAFDLLWTHAVEVDNAAWFPHHISQPTPARLAWCYGSLGLYVAFDRARRIAVSPAHRCESLLRGIKDQYSFHDGIRDASVCHGHAGILAFSVAVEADDVRQLASVVASAADRTRQSLKESGGTSVLYASANGTSPCRNLLEGAAGCVLAINSLERENSSNWMDLLGYN